jgi:hypothetical protein
MLRMVVVGMCWLGFAASAMAEVVEFIVDPAITRWELDGSYYRGGIEQGEFAAQSPGSEITSLGGVLRVDLTPTTIQFLPGSVLDAVPQAVPQQPDINGGPGVAVADYGVASPTLGTPAPIFGVRDFGFTLSSPVIPLVEFESGLQFAEDLQAVVNARIDYDLGSAAGSHSFTNWQRGFDNDNVGRITTDGLVQTIRMQNYLGEIIALQSPADSSFRWSGPIVATRIIPEPGGLLLAVIAIGIGLRGRRCAARAVN